MTILSDIVSFPKDAPIEEGGPDVADYIIADNAFALQNMACEVLFQES